MSDAHLPTVLEAILFGAGRSMSVEELSELLEKSQTEVQSALQDLPATIRRRRDSALQLSDVAGRWIFEVRPSLSPHLPKSFRADIPQRLLPAAALIAYHQPMAQSQLVDMLGQRAYDHVRDLARKVLIDGRRDGMTRSLATTRSFAEYLGCPEGAQRTGRTWFEEQAAQLGLTSVPYSADLSREEQLLTHAVAEEPD